MESRDEEAQPQTQDQLLHLFTWGDPSVIGRGGNHLSPAIAPQGKKDAQPEGLREEGYPILSVSLGSGHSALLMRSGNVYTWGMGTSGRLGHGDERKVKEPQLVEKLKKEGVKVQSISAGFFHSGVVTTKGALYTCGRGYKGFLGHQSQANITSFKVVEALKATPIRQFCAARNHSIALATNGDVYSFGFPKYGRLGHGDEAYYRLPKKIEALSGRVVQIHTFGAHSVALTDKGEVFMWGSGASGRLGLGDEQTHATPQKLAFFEDKQVKTVLCGYDFSAALTVEGQLFTWGSNNNGQLGLGDTDNRLLPTHVEALQGQEVIDFNCGAYHMAAVTAEGKVYTWGKGPNGELGHGSSGESSMSSVPVEVALSLKERDNEDKEKEKEEEPPTQWRVVKVFCGGSHTAVLAVKAD